jgi:hypothetical protein
MSCVDARQIADDRTGRPCTDLSRLAAQTNALAAVSGGFFLYSEPDIELPSQRTDPVGLLVDGGKIRNPPMFRRAALMQDGATGAMTVEKVGMDGIFVKIGDEVNALGFRVGRNGVRVVHRGDCKTLPISNKELAISIVGTRVHRAVMAEGTENENENDGNTACSTTCEVNVPLAGFVLVVPLEMLDNGAGVPSTSSTCTSLEGANVSYTFPPERSNITAAMAGGPVLLSDDDPADEALDLPSEDFRGSAPPVTFSQDETFDRNLLPRMGAGVTADGELVLTAIDGRNLDRALGLTLRGTANLLEALGCVRALNLDGGSSKRMVIRHKVHGHQVVCLSTTEIKAKAAASTANDEKDQEEVDDVDEVGEDMEKHKENQPKPESTPELSRPVHSAILFLPPE